MTGAMPAMWLDMLSMYPYPSKCILNHWSGFNIPSRRWRPWLLPSPSSASWKWTNLKRLCGDLSIKILPLSSHNEWRDRVKGMKGDISYGLSWDAIPRWHEGGAPCCLSAGVPLQNNLPAKKARAPFRWLFVGMLLAVLNSGLATQLRLADSSPTCSFDGNLIKLILGRCEFCSPFCSSFKMTGMPNKSHGKSMNGSTSQR